MAERELRFVKLDPAPSVRVRSQAGGQPLEGRARGITPDALLIDLQAPAADAAALTEVSVAFDTHDGPLEATARVDRDAQVNGSLVLRFQDLEASQVDQLESFITRHRKADHIRICLNEAVGTEVTRAGFDDYRLPHEALPELHKAEVNLGASVFGKRVEAPILISCMTGGSELAKVINQRLARAAHKHGLALGLGSQRALLVDPSLLDTYRVRDLAPDVLLFGNVGAVQLNYGMTKADCDRLVAMVGADVLVLHLNPLQEAVQPEGDVDFRGLKAKIRALAEQADYPVILKEVGNGIGPALARWTQGTALAGVDTAGAGGTSWSRVESYRSDSPLVRTVGRTFGEWGWPTAEALVAARAALPAKVVIASGGIRDGLDVAKALALGADLVGLARPFLEAAAKSEAALDTMISTLLEELRVAMFCTGARDVDALRAVGIEAGPFAPGAKLNPPQGRTDP